MSGVTDKVTDKGYVRDIRAAQRQVQPREMRCRFVAHRKHEAQMQTNRTIIRGWDGYERKTGKGWVQGWRDVRARRFPPPIELGPNSIGWFEDEIDEWLASRPRRTYGAAKAA
jgi:predicted DNA-binding transcriptional regulator AlpA